MGGEAKEDSSTVGVESEEARRSRRARQAGREERESHCCGGERMVLARSE